MLTQNNKNVCACAYFFVRGRAGCRKEGRQIDPVAQNDSFLSTLFVLRLLNLLIIFPTSLSCKLWIWECAQLDVWTHTHAHTHTHTHSYTHSQSNTYTQAQRMQTDTRTKTRTHSDTHVHTYTHTHTHTHYTHTYTYTQRCG